MKTELVREYESGIPRDDEHPYRTGPWQPNTREYNAFDLDITGDLPGDLEGIYIRNTENPLHDSLGRYHPFDGDAMLHSLYLGGGQAEYRNRFVPTDGFREELTAGRPLWAGLRENPAKSERDGWGARTRLKDSSSTDVVIHRGIAATSFYQCGDIYELDPRTLELHGKAAWTSQVTPGWGVSAHTKVDEATNELLFFNYSKEAPYMHYGVIDQRGELVHYIPVPLPGPRLPHDMAFTERYAILNDLPLFWDPDALSNGAHAVRYFPQLPSRFAIVPRRGDTTDIRWFEARPTYVLHWINAYEEGDEIVLDGYAQNPKLGQRTPLPENLQPFAVLDINGVGAHAYRWRFNLRTGEVKEGPIEEQVSEFGMINPSRAGKPYRYTWAMTAKPGWFLFDGIVRLDVNTGQRQIWQFPEGVYASESPMAPATDSQAEDDGYVLTYVTDMNRDSSSCLVFRADDIAAGPMANIALPQRICVGTHTYWAGKDKLTAKI
ncbi:MAG: carotenoid oxygenase family protein [Pseudomonadota bacterium]